MGRRNRKRTVTASAASPRAAAPRPAAPPRRAARSSERPPAPWGRFPLVELCVLTAIGIGVAGAVIRGHQGAIMLVCAAVLGSLAGLELVIREHFAGFKSHTSALAGALAVAVGAILFLLVHPPRGVALGVAVAVFGVAWKVLRDVFRRRSGGYSFR